MDDRSLELLENCSDNMSNSRTTETAGLSSRTDDADDEKSTPLAYLELTESRGDTENDTDLDHVESRTQQPVKWARFNIFLGCLCFVALCESCIVRGYSGAILTTLQKQFGFTTRQSGLICTSYEFGHIPFVIVVSLLSKRFNRSKLIGVGGILMAIGCVIYLIPMFITFANPGLLRNVATEETLNADGSSSLTSMTTSSGPGLCAASSNYTATCPAGAGGSSWMVAILCVSQCILGIGASPIYTLGLTYLYENIPKRSRYPIYSGLMYALAGLGPVFGFGMGSYFLTIYVLPWNVPDAIDGPSHPQFVGAWWIGLVICTGVTLCASSLLFFFPDNYGALKDGVAPVEKRLTVPTSDSIEDKKSDDIPVNMNFGTSCADIPRGLKHIFRTRIWLGVTIVLIAENSAVVWFATYFPKYLETNFHVQRSSASIMTGLILIPAACSGVVSGGLIAKKLKRTLSIVKYLFAITVVNMTLLFFSMLIRCEPLPFAGVTSSHDLSAMRFLPQSRTDRLSSMNQTLHDRCNAQCGCSFNDYAPVCASGGGRSVTYYNPCFAGCTQYTNQSVIDGSITRTTYAYHNCSCAANVPTYNYSNADVSFGNSTGNVSFFGDQFVTVTNGACDANCTMLIPFIVVIFFVVYVVTSGQNPTLILTLQSVGDEHRSFGLAVQTFFIRSLAYLPAPIYFGQLFDAQCILTQPNSCEAAESDDLSIGYYNSGYCILYDTNMLPYTMLGCMLLLKVVVLAAFIFCWVSAKQDEDKAKKLKAEKQRTLVEKAEIDNEYDDEQRDTVSAAQHGNMTPKRSLGQSESRF